MNRYRESITGPVQWLMALLLAAALAGCGGGQDTVLGAGLPPLAPGILSDTIKPRVTASVPADGSVVAPANAAITVTFTEAMALATIIPANFTVYDTTTSTAVPAIDVTYDAASKTATFTHAALTPGDSYTATITIGAQDEAGNPLAGNQAALPAASSYVWTFTASAVDAVAPTVTLTAPVDGAGSVDRNTTVNATFSEDMDPASICGTTGLTIACPTATFTLVNTTLASNVTGTVSYVAGSRIATFTPSALLPAGDLYTATITVGATDLAGNALAAGAMPNPWTFTTGATLAPGALNLGSAGTFGIMATAAITTANASVINGDVSLEPGTSMTGFPPGVINGEIHINDTISHQARADLLSAYNTAKGLACTTAVGTTDLGTLYVYPTGIPPGVYCSGSTMLVGAHIILDAGGDANAVWVFQAGSSVTVNADIELANGAQTKNVFWVPTFDVTIGSGITFNGTILAGRSATSAGSVTLNGRILAGATTAGTIALNGPPSTINVPAP